MKEIKEVIEKAKSTYSCGPGGSFHHAPKFTMNESELHYLLSLMAENAFIEGADADQDELYVPAFQKYWKQFTDTLKEK